MSSRPELGGNDTLGGSSAAYSTRDESFSQPYSGRTDGFGRPSYSNGTRELAAWCFVITFAAVPAVLLTFFALVWMALFL